MTSCEKKYRRAIARLVSLERKHANAYTKPASVRRARADVNAFTAIAIDTLGLPVLDAIRADLEQQLDITIF